MKSKFRMFVVLALTITSVTGCAFGTRHPLLGYTPVVKGSGPKNVTLYVEKFKDERTDKNIIGNVRNGWGLKTADVITDTTIAEWVTDAFKTELGNDGYVVSKDRTELTAGGEVITVYCDSYLQYEGNVTLGVVLKKGDQVILDKKYTGKATNFNWAATAKSYGLTVEQSLQSAMKQILTDVDQALAS